VFDMDKKSEIIDRLIKEKGYSRRSFAAFIGIPQSTLQSALVRGFGGISTDIGVKVCKELGISVERLYVMALEELTEESNNGGAIKEPGPILAGLLF
jgi:plasmid maintenance system antidote protein VapI